MDDPTMAAVVSLRPATPDAPSVPTVLPPLKGDEAALGLINELRLVGLRCRSARKAPPIEACQLIADPEASRAVTLDMLMRSLPQALGRPPVLFAPGTVELSFDEAWLLQLVAALRAEDADSAAFLLRSRVPAYARRGLVFLLNTALPPL
jgi:hypothetical protein